MEEREVVSQFVCNCGLRQTRHTESSTKYRAATPALVHYPHVMASPPFHISDGTGCVEHIKRVIRRVEDRRVGRDPHLADRQQVGGHLKQLVVLRIGDHPLY